MTDTPPLDEELWFTLNRCEGRHFILGNPHTFPGRMMAWCPQKERSFFFSLGEIEDASPLARAWIAGFLAGNEPSPPRDESGVVDFEGEAYAAWFKSCEQFRRTGQWPEESE